MAIAFIGLVIASCASAPKEYTQGVKKMKLGYYEEAIDQFKLIDLKNTKWRTKGVEKIENCIDSLFALNNFSRLRTFAQKTVNDTLISVRFISKANQSLTKYIDSDFLKGFAFYDSLSVVLLANDEARKTILKLEDKAFLGTWEAVNASIDGYKVVFTRENKSDETEDNFIKGYSTAGNAGWKENQLIYRDIFYNTNGEFECRVRVFHQGYEGYYFSSPSYSYFTKKAGVITFLSKDSILIDYEGSVGSTNKTKFIRVGGGDKPKVSESPKTKENNCTVTGYDVNIRIQPSSEAKSIIKINNGDYFQVLEEGPSDEVKGKKGKWQKVKYQNNTGWIFDAFIEC